MNQRSVASYSRANAMVYGVFIHLIFWFEYNYNNILDLKDEQTLFNLELNQYYYLHKEVLF